MEIFFKNLISKEYLGNNLGFLYSQLKIDCSHPMKANLKTINPL